MIDIAKAIVHRIEPGHNQDTQYVTATLNVSSRGSMQMSPDAEMREHQLVYAKRYCAIKVWEELYGDLFNRLQVLKVDVLIAGQDDPVTAVRINDEFASILQSIKAP